MAVFALTTLCLSASEAPPAPPFTLPVRGGAGQVSLDQLQGNIVILDFFAHWCGPCVRASSELETGVRAYYHERKGNARGIPVRVFGVNIEAALPDKTDTFVARTGMQDVLEDPGGDLFKRLGGVGLPLIVIIDAAGVGPARIVYQKSGFEGQSALRAVIDRIRPSPGEDSSETLSTGTSAGQTVDPGANEKGSLDFASMWAKDILLTDTSIEYRRTGYRGDLGLSFSHGHIGLEYVPESALQHSNEVDEDRYRLDTRGRFIASERLTLNGSAGGYSGYMDYRSLWLNEHFRQLFGRREGYEEADPWGVSFSGGARWEYLPASGFLQADLSYLHDVISPGYTVQLTFPPTLVRYRDTYDTISGKLTLENVLTPELRAQQVLQITDTTDRELRFSGQSSLNWAVAEHWVARFVLAGTVESPQFESWSTQATVERDWNETFFLSLFARYYEDTGQIENALLAENTAAPALHASYFGAGFRWEGAHSSVKLTAGPYFSRYEDPSSSGATFGHLYADRDWLSVQLAFVHAF